MEQEYIYITKGILPTEHDNIVINWVNLEHNKPFFGMEIVNGDISFCDYKSNFGRTIFRWKPLEVDSIILPDEVVDEKSLFQYLEDAGF